MKIDKRVMHPERIKQLKVIADLGHDTIALYVSNMTWTRKDKVERNIQKFKELGLITFKDEEYFRISEKGKKFLEKLT